MVKGYEDREQLAPFCFDYEYFSDIILTSLPRYTDMRRLMQ